MNRLTKHESLFLGFLVIVDMLAVTKIVLAVTANARVFPVRESTKGYTLVQAYMTTPNPQLQASQWVAAPVGLTDLSGNLWVESGPTKDCYGDCKLHPYGSWRSSSGQKENVDTTITLGAGGAYRYQSYFVGGTGSRWRSEFCDANGCKVMVEGPLNTGSITAVASGGESSASGIRWGSVTSSNATLKSSGDTNIYSWCFARVVNNVVGGTVSSCNTQKYSWTVTY
jgi:hypothetical protein